MSEENAGNESDQNAGDNNQGAAQVLNFDAWLEKQDEGVKGLLDKHTGGLKSALSAERDRNKDLEKNLREAASKVEKGSESEKRLTELANQANEANRKSVFYEGAAAAGVNNLKLAYHAAVADDLFRKDGSVDFESMKEIFPELFGAGGLTQRANHAGAGSNGNALGKSNMNDFIRKAAGVS